MAWAAVYRVADGGLVSVGDRVATLDATLASVALAGPPPDNREWNPATRAFDVVRAVYQYATPVDEFMASPEIVALTTAQKTNIRTAIARFLAR